MATTNFTDNVTPIVSSWLNEVNSLTHSVFDASTTKDEAREALNLVVGTDVQAYDATILVDSDIGINIQAYDATILVDSDIGINIQAYSADLTRIDTAIDATNSDATAITINADESVDFTNNIFADNLVESYDNIVALRAITVAPQMTHAKTKGHTGNGDGGEGDWYWHSTSTATDNNATIIKATAITTGRWIRFYSGAVNVKWFGAKGDGTTDDSAAIQAAIDYKYNSDTKFSGGEIFIPQDEYNLSTTGITLYENTHLVGENGASPYNGAAIFGGSWLLYSGTGNAVTIDGSFSVPSFDGRRNIHIKGINIKVQSGVNAGIYADFMTQFTIEDVQIRGVSTYGVYFRNCYQGYVKNLWIIGVKTYAHYVTVDAADSVFTGQTTYESCRFEDSSTAGVHLDVAANVMAQQQFTRCHFKSNGYGLYIDKAQKVNLITCHFEGNSNNQIFVTAATDKGPVISGCKSNYTAATDSTGDTDGSTAVITGMTDTSDFNAGDFVTVSAGFPSATVSYGILSKTSTTITLDTNSDSAQTNVTVTSVNYFLNAEGDDCQAFGNAIDCNTTGYGFRLSGDFNHIYDNNIKQAASNKAIVIETTADKSIIGYNTDAGSAGNFLTDNGGTNTMFEGEQWFISDKIDISGALSAVHPFGYHGTDLWVRGIDIMAVDGATTTGSNLDVGLIGDQNKFVASFGVGALSNGSTEKPTLTGTQFWDDAGTLVMDILTTPTGTGNIKVIVKALPWNPG